MSLQWIAVFVGGGLGSVARFGVSRIFQSLDMTHLPWATLVSNTLSSVILALIAFRLQPQTGAFAYPLLAVGFCGGFSTFSTFSLETVQLFRLGEYAWAGLNVIINTLVCLAVVYILLKNER